MKIFTVTVLFLILVSIACPAVSTDLDSLLGEARLIQATVGTIDPSEPTGDFPVLCTMYQRGNDRIWVYEIPERKVVSYATGQTYIYPAERTAHIYVSGRMVKITEIEGKVNFQIPPE